MLSSYKLVEKDIQVLEQSYGREVAMVNFIMHLCNNSNPTALHKVLFNANPLMELRGSQQPGALTETMHSQATILLYKSKRQDAQYALQLGKAQINLGMDFFQVFITCLKSYYFFNIEYPIQIQHFYSFWEQQLRYGCINPSSTVKRLSKNIEKCLETDTSDEDEDNNQSQQPEIVSPESRVKIHTQEVSEREESTSDSESDY